MGKLNLKRFMKQWSMACDFYGRSDITPEECYRYVASPFLARQLEGVECDRDLFELFSKHLEDEPEEPDVAMTIDLEQSFEGLEKSFRRYVRICWVLLVSIFLSIVVGVSVIWAAEKGQSEIAVNIVLIILVTGFVALMLISVWSKKISIFLIQRSRTSKAVCLHLRNEFSRFKHTMEYWEHLSWQQFERAVGDRLREYGFDAINTRLTGDQGVDILIVVGDRRVVVQCKNTKTKVGPAFVRDFVGTIVSEGAAGGILVSRCGFTDSAISAGAYANVHLLSIREFSLLSKVQVNKMIE